MSHLRPPSLQRILEQPVMLLQIMVLLRLGEEVAERIGTGFGRDGRERRTVREVHVLRCVGDDGVGFGRAHGNLAVDFPHLAVGLCALNAQVAPLRADGVAVLGEDRRKLGAQIGGDALQPHALLDLLELAGRQRPVVDDLLQTEFDLVAERSGFGPLVG